MYADAAGENLLNCSIIKISYIFRKKIIFFFSKRKIVNRACADCFFTLHITFSLSVAFNKVYIKLVKLNI